MGTVKSYYAIIPATVRYDKNLPDGAKLLYGEITALCNQEGFCWASNQYFADLYGKSKNTISRWIALLEKLGYIIRNIRYKTDSKEVDARCITICDTPQQKCSDPPPKIEDTSPQILGEPPSKNGEDNNTVNNTNNIPPISPKGKKVALTTLIEEYTQNPELRDALLGFIEMRSRGKSSFTERALKLNLSTLTKLGPSEESRIKIVNRSVERGWKGFFKLDEDSKEGKAWNYL